MKNTYFNVPEKIMELQEKGKLIVKMICGEEPYRITVGFAYGKAPYTNNLENVWIAQLIYDKSQYNTSANFIFDKMDEKNGYYYPIFGYGKTLKETINNLEKKMNNAIEDLKNGNNHYSEE